MPPGVTGRAVGHGTAAGILVAATMLVSPAPVRADGWNTTAGLVSDHVYRGISQSRGRAAVILGTGYATDGGWSAASELASAGTDRAGQDIDLALGVYKHWQLGPDWSAQAGYEHLAYLGSTQRRRYDRDELSASLNWQGRWSVSATVSPDTTTLLAPGRRHTGAALSIETGWRERLSGRLALDAGVGYYALRPGHDGGYPYASVGLSSGWGPVQAQLAYITSRAANRGLVAESAAGDRVAASLWWSF